MFSFGATFRMLGASWQVLKKDTEVLVFFMLGMVCKLGLAYFAYKQLLVLYPDGIESLQTLTRDIKGERREFYITAAGFIFSYHLIGQFFNAAIVGSAARRLSGKNPNVWTGLWDALKRLPSLIVWVVVYASLITFAGLFKRKGKLQKIFGSAIQAAFHIATYLVLPLIMIENANPFSAMGRSGKLMGKTWGYQITANVSLYVIRFLISLPGFAVMAAGAILFKNDQFKWISVGAGTFLVVLGAGIVQTLTEIFRTALYLYVRDEKAPEGFTAAHLHATFSAA